MSTLNYRITLHGGDKLDMSAGINAKVIPLLSQAVQAVAQQAMSDWQTAVYSAKLWSGERDAYAKSISWRMTGDFSAVVEADYEHAEAIETGRSPRDLKKMLDTSTKVRRTEDGRRFLVIPMRHNTPGNTAHAKAMPGAVHALAKQMSPSKITAAGKRESGEAVSLSPKTGMSKGKPNSNFLSDTSTKKHFLVASRTYSWGDRLTKAALKDAGIDNATAKRYAGMVKMQTNTPGGSKSSGYMTFRVMIDGQTGKWIIPAQPGMYLAKKVTENLQPKALAAFQAAVTKTVSG